MSLCFNKYYKKIYGSNANSNINILTYIEQILNIKISCININDYPFQLSKDNIELKARNMYSHKKHPHEIVYLEYYMPFLSDDYKLVIDTKSGLVSDTVGISDAHCLYNSSISIFTLMKEMYNNRAIDDDILKNIANYLKNKNFISRYEHDSDCKSLLGKYMGLVSL